jgi:hypothetical protein
MSDLALESTDDLIAELRRRHDATVFAMLNHRTENKSRFAYDYSGDLITAIGLCEQAKHDLILKSQQAVPVK